MFQPITVLWAAQFFILGLIKFLFECGHYLWRYEWRNLLHPIVSILRKLQQICRSHSLVPRQGTLNREKAIEFRITQSGNPMRLRPRSPLEVGDDGAENGSNESNNAHSNRSKRAVSE